jgi:hypothetical protein
MRYEIVGALSRTPSFALPTRCFAFRVRRVAMSQKRPATKRPPVRQRLAPPAPAPAPRVGAPGGGGLLGSIIGGMKKQSAAAAAAAPGGAPRVLVTKADVMTREEKLVEARKAFEREHSARMKRELVDDPAAVAEDARVAFAPMEKIWRNVLHEIASDLNLHSESVELDPPAAEGDKYVVVYARAPVVELTEAEEMRRAALAKAARASGPRKGEALTDRAPALAPGDAGQELTVVGTVKRDVRGVAQTALDMRKRKREEAGEEGETGGEGRKNRDDPRLLKP